jgi:hypothetical protein
MSDIHMLDAELRARTAEYEQIWNKRNIYVAQLFKTSAKKPKISVSCYMS